ncbi:MAG TPA: MBL fold metallo-hydrolase [Deferrimonas sp.]
MLIETLAVGPLQVNCCIVGCPETRDALVVDPGDEGRQILDTLAKLGLTLKTIVNTHGHFDHIGGNSLLVAESGAELLIHEADLPLLRRAREAAAIYGLTTVPSPEPSRFLQEDEILTVGTLQFRVIHVPGHSPGGICLYGHGHLFAGDVLFFDSVGRTDLPGGDHDLLIGGIRQKLLCLPESTLVHTGHGPDTTIGREKQMNPFL